ncbi:transketolase [Synechococcus sp. 63AY4M2]|uniref:transketolase n=1 Tax=unclassified Synechococcus TaxID=2626047 RepID=UPI000C179261|nr:MULTISPECIES: transketolase [unclassified Synechococcus]PIK85868.1 transketolase [Synechococcus sp. 63AY4M2]PIK89129.1 transketolase [Synechococcus sp. 65AY6A5]PIK97182.1 transketolase [Synechococcus sp. 63AY4M1]PIL02108.1 transketolase [Synechococcus sp. 65AY640]
MTLAQEATAQIPAFCEGIRYFGDPWPEFDRLGQEPAVDAATGKLRDPGSRMAAYQTLLYADALRYLTLQMTASKASGHPGGFASQAEAYAALVYLGQKNIPTEVGHHAPGFYAAMFLDGSLAEMGIHTVSDLQARFREREGLLGHLSGYIPGLLAPAGPLGQGQHFAMAAALLYPDRLFPVTIGDGGLGEPYVMSSMIHFHTAFPQRTNFLPVLVWNGYSQEHHSMISTFTNAQMAEYWRGNGFEEVVLVDAKDFDDAQQPGPYVDSTQFSLEARLAFVQRVLVEMERAIQCALGGHLTVFILKQLKGAGVHAKGSKSHNLYAHHTLDHPDIVAALEARALHPAAWALVRQNCERAAGGPAAKVVVTEFVRPLPPLGSLNLTEFSLGDKQVSTTAIGALVLQVGQKDPDFLVANADGNEASGLANVNQGLKVIHPTADPLYNQQPQGQVYEPLSEDACAGLTAGLALFGGRSLWCSYESFAVNGLPIWQTVTQAMAELRRPTPSAIALYTAGALEQGRNGWTHQRPEIEAYLAAMMRNGNIFPLFPPDANCAQAAYEWALSTYNKGIPIFASKTPLPIRTTLEQARQAVEQGCTVLQEVPGSRTVVFAVVGDMILLPVFAAAEQLKAQGIGSKIVSVVSPRRLYRPGDIAWSTCAQPDGEFMSDQEFAAWFAGEALIGVTGGSSLMLEPLLLRYTGPRDIFAWKRGETTATPTELMDYNGLTAQALAERAKQLLG